MQHKIKMLNKLTSTIKQVYTFILFMRWWFKAVYAATKFVTRCCTMAKCNSAICGAVWTDTEVQALISIWSDSTVQNQPYRRYCQKQAGLLRKWQKPQ